MAADQIDVIDCQSEGRATRPHYLRRWAAELNIMDLVARAMEDARVTE